MRKYLLWFTVVIGFSAVVLFAGCGKQGEEPATAEEETAAAEETAAPETTAEDLRGAFAAKVEAVDEYMKAHDVTNTSAEKIASTLEGYQKDFEDLASRAAEDEELAAQCGGAAEAMEFYVKSLRAPEGDLDSLQLAIDAEAKWTGVKESLDAGLSP